MNLPINDYRDCGYLAALTEACELVLRGLRLMELNTHVPHRCLGCHAPIPQHGLCQPCVARAVRL